jgi:hypothetical protein
MSTEISTAGIVPLFSSCQADGDARRISLVRYMIFEKCCRLSAGALTIRYTVLLATLNDSAISAVVCVLPYEGAGAPTGSLP